jgi:hypothetical protein
MAFQKRGSSNVKISGFWNRKQGETLTGKYLKYVPNARDPKHVRPFIILQAEAPKKGETATFNVEGTDKSEAVKGGEFLGVAANWSLMDQLRQVEDVNKRCRITVDGERANPNGGKPMTLVTVEVDE